MFILIFSVLDFLGFSCNEHRAEPPVYNDPLFSSEYRLIEEENGGNYIYTFYIYPLAFLTADDTATTINADISSNALQTAITNFMSSWPYYVPTLVSITSGTVPNTDVYFVDTFGNEKKTFDLEVKENNITVKNLKLNQNGYIWIYAFRKDPDTSGLDHIMVPNKNEFRYYINRRLLDENYIGLRYYDASIGNPITIEFQGLKKDNDYFLFFFAQNEDSGDENLTSYVYSTHVRTSAVRFSLGFSLLVIVLLLIVV